MTATQSADSTLVHDYLFLRRAIGLVGMLLPIVLIVGNLIWPPGVLLDSISASYYSPLRGVFVGSMVAVGVFLLSYRGYGRIDDLAGDIGAVGAIGVALFPTTPLTEATSGQQTVGTMHTTFAGIFFLTLVFFCLFLFPRTNVTGDLPARKALRNLVYRACGVVILAAIILIAVTQVSTLLPAIHPMLWLETIAILAFGVAWAVKGETLGVLADSPAVALAPA